MVRPSCWCFRQGTFSTMDQLQSQKNDSFSGMLLKETPPRKRGGRLPAPFILINGKSQIVAKIKTTEQKRPNARESLTNSLSEVCRAFHSARPSGHIGSFELFRAVVVDFIDIKIAGVVICANDKGYPHAHPARLRPRDAASIRVVAKNQPIREDL